MYVHIFRGSVLTGSMGTNQICTYDDIKMITSWAFVNTVAKKSAAIGPKATLP